MLCRGSPPVGVVVASADHRTVRAQHIVLLQIGFGFLRRAVDAAFRVRPCVCSLVRLKLMLILNLARTDSLHLCSVRVSRGVYRRIWLD